MTPRFSIILPLHNEAHRVAPLAHAYRQALDSLDQPWELLFVDNGSRDNAYALAAELALEDPRLRAFQVAQAGWGRAVKLGLQQARGSLMCYTNSARTDLNDLLLALRYALVHPEVVVKANRIVRDSWLRRLGSSLYNFEYRLLFQVPTWDVNGTPKVLPRRVLQQLPTCQSLSDGDLLDAQLMARCFHARVRILEMPVLHNARYGGTSTTGLGSAWNLYTGLLALRWRGY